jgi:hypothetical protein
MPIYDYADEFKELETKITKLESELEASRQNEMRLIAQLAKSAELIEVMQKRLDWSEKQLGTVPDDNT